jgi:multidrug efflux pump subunit AcrB
MILLRDIGHAEDASVIQKSRVLMDGRPQVYVPIYRQGGTSSLAVADGVRGAIPEIEHQIEAGSKLEFVMDQSVGVRQSIKSLVEEGIIGGVLVGLMILVFLGNWRMTLIATLSMPLAILAAIVGLHATGNTINVMTLGGLFLAIGPLVDNAIVVLENIHRHQAMGKSAVRAAFDGPSELTLPVLVATIVTIIVLCPVALTPGIGGFLFRPLTLAVGFAMVASFLLSWTFVPGLCARLLKGHAQPLPVEPAGDGNGGHGATGGGTGFFARAYASFDRFLTGAADRYVGVLRFALHRRPVVLGLAAALFVGSLSLFPLIGQEFFPQVDAGQITINVRGPSNWRLDATERRVIEVEGLIRNLIPLDEIQTVISEIGLNNDWSAAYTQNAGQQDAIVRVQLTDHRTRSAQTYAVQLRRGFEADERFADLRFSFDTGGMVTAALNYGASSPIDVQISGGDRAKALELAREIRGRVAGVPGAADVRVLQRADAPYLIIDVDRQKAAAVGLTARDVVMQVVTAMNSSIAMTRNFWIDSKSGNQYFVAVQYPEDPSFTIADLNNVVATGTKQSTPVQLASLVTIRPSTSDVEINHDGLRRVVDVMVNTEERDTGGVASDVQEALKGLAVPDGMRVELKGEYARMKDSFHSLSLGLALAAVLVYLVLAPLLRSFVGPLIILGTIPLGLIGVLAMLYATGTTLNVMSEVGVIFLVGIVVTQGVLLVDFANQLRRQGATVRDAVIRAAAIRFRPILMTFLATFLDLLPLAIGLGKGSEMITPLARAVVGGLLTSTVLTLIVVPVLYTLLIREDRAPHLSLAEELAAATPPPEPHRFAHPHPHPHHPED